MNSTPSYMPKYQPNLRARLKGFTAYSFTRWKDYDSCPAYAAYKHLDKADEGPKSPAMERGAMVADNEEKYVKGLVSKLVPELALFRDEFSNLRKAWAKEGGKTLFVEEMWHFRADWTPTVYNDWDAIRVRVKTDLARLSSDGARLKVIDFKTGKMRPEQVDDYLLQLDLYEAGGISRFPNVEEVETQLVFTDLGVGHPGEGPRVSTREQALGKRLEWEDRAAPMLADKVFAPKPGPKCVAFGGCPYSKTKSGPCKF